MLFSLQTMANAAALFSMLSLTNARADTHLCETGPIQLTKVYGKPSNDLAFCDTKWDQGLTVTAIQMWSTKWHVKAFQLTYSDNSKGPVHGDNLNTEGNDGNWYNVDVKSWKDGDSVTDVHLASNYWNNADAFGGITMDVAGQKFSVKSDIGNFAGEPQDFGSGLLIGAYGSAGGFVNSFGLVFLSGTVGKSEIVNMTFPDSIDKMNKEQIGVQSVVLKEGVVRNNSPAGSANQSFIFQSTVAQTTARTMTFSNTKTFGEEIAIGITAKLGVPEVVDVESSVTNTVKYSIETITSRADFSQLADTTAFSLSGTLTPGRGAHCRSVSMSGDYSVDYMNVVLVTLQSGQTFKINRPAHFHSIGFTKAQYECPEMAIKDLPLGLPEISTFPSSKRAIEFSA